MPIIEWTDEFNVGNELIDRQHQKWIAIYNKAHDRMMSMSDEEFRSTGADAIEEMVEYGRYHFSAEENLMAEVEFAELERHKELHRAFMDQVERTRRDMRQGKYVLNSEVIKTIENWLVHHILNEDQKITPFLDKKG